MESNRMSQLSEEYQGLNQVKILLYIKPGFAIKEDFDYKAAMEALFPGMSCTKFEVRRSGATKDILPAQISSQSHPWENSFVKLKSAILYFKGTYEVGKGISNYDIKEDASYVRDIFCNRLAQINYQASPDNRVLEIVKDYKVSVSAKETVFGRWQRDDQ